MKRRDFITLVGGAAAWPLTTYAQQRDEQPRIGVLMTGEGPQGQARLAAFRQGLQQSGWIDGRNIRIVARWSGGDEAKMRKDVAELVALAPNVILATGSAGMGPLMQLSSTLPTVFVIVPDPVGAGYVNSLSRPGGNVTGFSLFEYSIGGKWLDLLKQIAPGRRVVGQRLKHFRKGLALVFGPTVCAGVWPYCLVEKVRAHIAH